MYSVHTFKVNAEQRLKEEKNNDFLNINKTEKTATHNTIHIPHHLATIIHFPYGQ